VVVPKRVLAYNPWKKEIDKWMSDLKPKCLILSGFIPPREGMLVLSSFQGDILLTTDATNDIMNIKGKNGQCFRMIGDNFLLLF
jgi:hypothetical protein